MKYIIVLLVSLSIFLACTTNTSTTKSRNNITNTDNLTASQYVINIDRDTTIETTNGAVVQIPKGALATDNGTTVTLEIKEAYSMQQMIEAGLTTQAGGQPLASGGMIYINAAAGQNVTIKQKIKVAIPASSVQKDMKLYKGEKDENGNVDWVKPNSLPDNPITDSLEKGKILFLTKCVSCHRIGQDLVGPNLAHFMKRFPPEPKNEYYYRCHTLSYGEGGMPFLLFPEADSIIEQTGTGFYYLNESRLGNPYLYFCHLRRMYGSIGPNFPNLTKYEYLSIFRYIQNESDRRALPLPKHAYLKDCTDSCIRYIEAIEIKQKINAAIKANGVLAQRNANGNNQSTPIINTPTPQQPASPRSYDDQVSPQNFESVYYQFTIETFGWYNIDILMKEREGVSESELFVRIQGQYKEKMIIYLAIPSLKVLLQAGATGKEADQYAFDTKDGKIRLPQNNKAYIIAMTETQTSIAYAIKEFTITNQQSIDISLAAGTKEEFNQSVSNLSLDGLQIRADNSKNAKEIINLEKQLKEAESMKPKGCDCDCQVKEEGILEAEDYITAVKDSTAISTTPYKP